MIVRWGLRRLATDFVAMVGTRYSPRRPRPPYAATIASTITEAAVTRTTTTATVTSTATVATIERS